MKKVLLIVQLLLVFKLAAQPGSGTKWTPDGESYYMESNGAIERFDVKSQKSTVVIAADKFKPAGSSSNLEIENFVFTEKEDKLLIFTNSRKVWRYNTRGDYWVLNLRNNQLQQLGKGLPASSLMFAKIAPDGSKAAYVSNRNIYVEDLGSGKIKQLTRNEGKAKLINGTFDWAYEEEFSCYDGFRWSPDSKRIAYWQIDASDIKDFYMLNNTDQIYAQLIPIEYPKVGEDPSACRIGVMDVKKGKTTWMNILGDNKQHYIPRMEWSSDEDYLMLQQLDRKQQESKIYLANIKTGESKVIYEEQDKNAWVDVRSIWHEDNPAGWEWINGGKEFLWVSDKDGYTHIYKVSADGKSETLVTKGDFDIIDPLMYDKNSDYVYYTASPENALQKYLYRSKVSSPGAAERISPYAQPGTHGYEISANGKYARHTFSNYYTPNSREWITLTDHKSLDESKGVQSRISAERKAASNIEFVKVTTKSGVEIEGWMAKPKDFDPSKKYATLFYVYSEPASQNAKDNWLAGFSYHHNVRPTDHGYIYIAVDGRGSPAPKGVAWRKSIYKNIGIINIKDQAEACLALQAKYPYIDKDRIAVHGWSGGGSTTLNLLFQYPEIYQTGVAVAAVANQLTYDNIYQERYMGVPPADVQSFIDGSPITHAKNLKGNLLYVHGQGDDNVHYQNAEMLINELVKYNKQFQFMAYPNRTHSISEGEGTRVHLNTLFINYLKEHCPPGPR